MSVDVKFRTSATTSAGKIHSEDGHLAFSLSVPKELGGSGDGTNLEQLFAAGYSACFLSSLRFAGQQRKVHLPPDTSVTADIGVGPRSEGGWGLVATLTINLAGIDREEVERWLSPVRARVPPSSPGWSLGTFATRPIQKLWPKSSTISIAFPSLRTGAKAPRPLPMASAIEQVAAAKRLAR